MECFKNSYECSNQALGSNSFGYFVIRDKWVNPLSANPTEWSNKLK